MKIYENISQLVGATSLLRLKNSCAALCVNADICAKLEYFYLAGSVKDRVALSMLDDAQASGKRIVVLLPDGGNRYLSNKDYFVYAEHH